MEPTGLEFRVGLRRRGKAPEAQTFSIAGSGFGASRGAKCSSAAVQTSMKPYPSLL